ncbi:Protein of unknown function [Mariniphaga anaerophila]|uniref:DUF432 domain-containing protein n=1 Tax=Mariniphaga anaerophila TaxID=1484053 RepID=A0A1M4T730_9BACT|nr:DUF432 domain-containing protein [Mariniphaga anaerophila]SHE40097.1 Protein of unknown function [Mariniphaga anaerophila]
MTQKSIFGRHQILPGEHDFFYAGNFYLGAKREKDGWLLLQTDNADYTENATPDFSGADFFQSGKSNKLFIAPSLPEKPLVFKGTRLHVSPGQRLNFFLKIPLTIQVYFSRKQPENLLKEFPVQRLSDTWFGDTFSGEPAFALGTEFFPSLNEVKSSDFEAICPISIFNDAPGVLQVERLIIRVENLALYLCNGKIIASQVAIEYKGKDVISSASYHFSKNIHGEKSELLVKPRNGVSKNLLKINFHFIKNLYKTEE